MSIELPKLSTITRILAQPESQFENLVRQTLRIELPPGPLSQLLKIQTSIEGGGLPRIETLTSDIISRLPTLPTLPMIEEIARVEKPTEIKVEVEKTPEITVAGEVLPGEIY